MRRLRMSFHTGNRLVPGLVPNHLGLALHGARLVQPKLLQQRQRFVRGNFRHNAPLLRFDTRNSFWTHKKTYDTNRIPPNQRSIRFNSM